MLLSSTAFIIKNFGLFTCR